MRRKIRAKDYVSDEWRRRWRCVEGGHPWEMKRGGALKAVIHSGGFQNRGKGWIGDDWISLVRIFPVGPDSTSDS